MSNVTRFPTERARPPDARALPMGEYCGHIVPTREDHGDAHRCMCALHDDRRCEGLARWYHVDRVYLCEIHASDWQQECMRRGGKLGRNPKLPRSIE